MSSYLSLQFKYNTFHTVTCTAILYHVMKLNAMPCMLSHVALSSHAISCHTIKSCRAITSCHLMHVTPSSHAISCNISSFCAGPKSVSFLPSRSNSFFFLFRRKRRRNQDQEGTPRPRSRGKHLIILLNLIYFSVFFFLLVIGFSLQWR